MVAVPVLLIFFNAFWANGEFNVRDVVKIILEPETYQALINSLIIASGTTIGSTIVGYLFRLAGDAHRPSLQGVL